MGTLLEEEVAQNRFPGIAHELRAAGLPLNTHSNVYENKRLVKSGPGMLLGFSAYTSLSTAQWIQVFDLAVAPASGQVPVAIFHINGGALASGDHLAVSYIFPGRFFLTGIWLANSTTGPTYTAGAADTFFDAQYL